MDERVSGEEMLGLVGRFESLHLPFSPSRRSVRILRAIVEVAALPVLDIRQQVALRHTIAPQIVGDDHPRRILQALQQTFEEPFGGFRIPSVLHKDIKNHSALIKEFMIRKHRLLQWYYETFRWYLSQPNTKLMVIGYSFSDSHINALLAEAYQSGYLKGVFIVDPEGRPILNPTRHPPVRMHSDLEDIPDLGSSTRLLSSTFAGDQFEHSKFRIFLEA